MHQRALPAAARAGDRHEFVRRDLERHLVERHAPLPGKPVSPGSSRIIGLRFPWRVMLIPALCPGPCFRATCFRRWERMRTRIRDLMKSASSRARLDIHHCRVPRRLDRRQQAAAAPGPSQQALGCSHDVASPARSPCLRARQWRPGLDHQPAGPRDQRPGPHREDSRSPPAIFACSWSAAASRSNTLALVWGWPADDRFTIDAPLLRQGIHTPSRIYLKQCVHPAGAPGAHAVPGHCGVSRAMAPFALVRAFPGDRPDAPDPRPSRPRRASRRGG